ncbi:10131_t:CDS:2, partial [Ambispora leptoticha]
MQQKYRELLGVELESIGQMHGTEDMENKMFKKQQERRQKPKPEIFPPSKPYHEYYKPHKDSPRNPPPIIPISPTDSTKSNDENDEDQWILKDRYSETRTETWVNQQDQHSRPNLPKNWLLPNILSLKGLFSRREHESLYSDQDHREEIITTHKRTRSHNSQISYPRSNNPRLTEWRKQNKVRRELYENQQREEITSEDEREMDEVEQEIENEGLNRPIRYQQQQGIHYDPQDQNEAGPSTNYTPSYTLYESDYTKTLKSIWRGLKDIYETSTIGDKTPPPSPKKEGIGVPDDISEMTDNDPNNFNFYEEIKEKYPIEMRHIILPTIKKGKNVKYQILSDENTDIPPMFIGYCKIKKPTKNDIYIGTIAEMAKEAIIVQPGIANDDQIMIMNISNKKFKIRKGQKIAN